MLFRSLRKQLYPAFNVELGIQLPNKVFRCFLKYIRLASAAKIINCLLDMSVALESG